MKGRGNRLPDPIVPPELPASVQVVNRETGVCFTAPYTAGDVVRAAPGFFEAGAWN